MTEPVWARYSLADLEAGNPAVVGRIRLVNTTRQLRLALEEVATSFVTSVSDSFHQLAAAMEAGNGYD